MSKAAAGMHLAGSDDVGPRSRRTVTKDRNQPSVGPASRPDQKLDSLPDELVDILAALGSTDDDEAARLLNLQPLGTVLRLRVLGILNVDVDTGERRSIGACPSLTRSGREVIRLAAERYSGRAEGAVSVDDLKSLRLALERRYLSEVRSAEKEEGSFGRWLKRLRKKHLWYID
jgi:hypothetical protein